MSVFGAWFVALGWLAALALMTWARSVVRRDVSLVDSIWGLFFALAAISYATTLQVPGPRGTLVVTLVLLWSLRLSGYVTWRNWGEPEDRRYAAIRASNEPHFALKSLYLVFLLQAGIAWIVSLPLLAAISGRSELGWLDAIGLSIWAVGLFFETVGDWQLARFKRDPSSKGQVMDRGLWRYTRHPNYFGDFCVWWGLYLIAVAAGGWWAIPGPLLMSALLLKVSGVSLLESDISDRRPAYQDYIRNTNAFFPGPSGNRENEVDQHHAN